MLTKGGDLSSLWPVILRTFLFVTFLALYCNDLTKACRSHRLGLLSLRTVAIWGQRTLRGAGCPMRCRTLSNIPGFYPLDANNILWVSKHCQISRGAKSLLVGIPALDQYFSTLAACWNNLESVRNCCQCLAPSKPTKQDSLEVGPGHGHFFGVSQGFGRCSGLRTCVLGSQLHKSGVIDVSLLWGYF